MGRKVAWWERRAAVGECDGDGDGDEGECCEWQVGLV